MDETFVDKFYRMQDSCDAGVLHHIINSLDLETIEALMDSCEDCLSDTYSYLRWRKCHMNPRVAEFHHNESVEQLLEWYNNPKSKKVVYSRKQLCRRFEHLSYDEQCSIIDAFIKRDLISDALFCCKYLTIDDFWREEYLPLVETIFEYLIKENIRSAYTVSKVIVARSTQEYIGRIIRKLDRHEIQDSVYDFSLRDVLVNLLVSYSKLPCEVLKNNTLTPDEYVYVMARKGLSVPEVLASMALDEITSEEYFPEAKRHAVVRSIAKMGYYDVLFGYGVKLKQNK